MEPNVNYKIVGAFVITLIASVILGIIWLSSGFTITKNKTYMIYMEESVSGLSIESPVEYNGVNVGSVTSIQLNHKDPQLVEVLIDIHAETPITVGTVATLKSRGITGIAFISLIDKSDNLTPLVPENGEPYLVIKTSPSLFTRIDTALNMLSINLSKISESFHTLFSNENQRSISNILFNLDRVTTVLSVNSQKLNTILVNVSKASNDISPLLLASSNAARMLQTQTLPMTYRLLSNLDNAARSLDEVVNNIKENPTILIRGEAKPSLGPGEKP